MKMRPAETNEAIGVPVSFPKSFLALSIAASIMAPVAQAQEEFQQRSERRNALIEEIMVTAQKKSTAEMVQDVPIAITAYSGEKIEAMFAVDLQDLGQTAPNVNLVEQGTVPHTGNFIIRGMGTAGQSIPSSDPAVGVVQDGMPFGLIYGVVTDLFDLESIEILRGPQGTLFGRNVTGGAVVMRTTRPTEELGGKVKVTAGSHDTRGVSAIITGPLTEKVAGKLAVLSKSHDGLWDNETLGGEHGESESLIVRPAITYTGENYDLSLLTEYAEITGDGMAPRNFFIFGEEIDPWDDNSTFTDKEGDLDLEWYSIIVEHNLDLWGGQLTTIGSYRDLEQLTWGDIDGAPGTVRFEFAEGSGLLQEQAALESRWSGSVGPKTNLTVGINLFDQEYTYNERRILIDLLEMPASSSIDHQTAGLFAQAEYNLTDELLLTVGGRYSYENKEAAIGVIGDPFNTGSCSLLVAPQPSVPLNTPPVNPPPPPPFDRAVDWDDCRQPFQDEESWSNFSPKLGLTWYVSENLMAYTSLSRGFRSGGYNVRFADTSIITQPDNPTSTPGPYDEEVVDAFEIGFKSEILDGRGRFNVAAFYNEFDDLQRSANNRSGVQSIFNAASATVQGIELEFVAAVTESLTLEASYGYTDAEYDEADFLVRATGQDPEDFEFQMVPERTASASATYDHDVGSLGYLTWRGSYSYVSETASDNFNFLILPQYELYGASVTFTTHNEKLKAALFGRNLKDEVYSHFGFDNTVIGSKTIWLAPPRTYGLEFTYLF
jgi:iron complex outermembrane receptor protein